MVHVEVEDIFAHDSVQLPEVSERLQYALRNIQFARRYMKSLLVGLSEDDWFWTPADSTAKFTTHVAWQVGHLAMAEYGLLLFRQRGRVREIDKNLMSAKFRKLFLRGTEPTPDREAYPSPSEILEVLDGVRERAMLEVPGFDGESLDEPCEAPHAAFATRMGAILFAADHEMIHTGQIGLLRRLMGKPPLR